MKTEYPYEPKTVEVFPIENLTDVILRKNVSQETVKRGEENLVIYTCDEVQVRKVGAITAQEVQDNFEVLWNGATGQAGTQPTLEQRVSALEAAQLAMIDLEVG